MDNIEDKILDSDELDSDLEVLDKEPENVDLDLEGDEEQTRMEKFASIVRLSLAEEHEASANYLKRAAKCEKHGLDDAAALFRDIAKEEVVHAGEFQALMEKYGILDQESIEQGEQEAQEILGAEVPAENLEESVNEATYIHKVTKAEWDRTHDDYKMIKDGKKYMMYLDPEAHATVLGPVEIIDEKPASEELEYAHNLEDRQKAVEEYKELRYQMMQAGASGTKPSPAMSKRSSELYRYLKDTEYLKEQNKTVNEEEFLDKGEIHSRITRILDLATEEDVKAVNLLSDVVNFMDVDQAQKFYEFIQEETGMNYDEIFGSKEVDEARGRENPAVSVYKRGVGNMGYPASNMRDAIAYVKKQNLDLENGDYFDIHTGHNLTDTDQLEFWGGTGAGFWRNVLNNPKTREKDKEVIRSREIKNIQDLHEDIAHESLESISELNSGDIIKTKDGKEAVIEGLLYDSNSIHIGYEVTYLDQKDSSYEYNDVLFDDIAEVLSKASNEDGTMASMGAAPTVVAGKGIVTAEPTKICEELKALREALKG